MFKNNLMNYHWQLLCAKWEDIVIAMFMEQAVFACIVLALYR